MMPARYAWNSLIRRESARKPSPRAGMPSVASAYERRSPSSHIALCVDAYSPHHHLRRQHHQQRHRHQHHLHHPRVHLRQPRTSGTWVWCGRSSWARRTRRAIARSSWMGRRKATSSSEKAPRSRWRPIRTSSSTGSVWRTHKSAVNNDHPLHPLDRCLAWNACRIVYKVVALEIATVVTGKKNLLWSMKLVPRLSGSTASLVYPKMIRSCSCCPTEPELAW